MSDIAATFAAVLGDELRVQQFSHFAEQPPRKKRWKIPFPNIWALVTLVEDVDIPESLRMIDPSTSMYIKSYTDVIATALSPFYVIWQEGLLTWLTSPVTTGIYTVAGVIVRLGASLTFCTITGYAVYWVWNNWTYLQFLPASVRASHRMRYEADEDLESLTITLTHLSADQEIQIEREMERAMSIILPGQSRHAGRGDSHPLSHSQPSAPPMEVAEGSSLTARTTPSGVVDGTIVEPIHEEEEKQEEVEPVPDYPPLISFSPNLMDTDSVNEAVVEFSGIPDAMHKFVSDEDTRGTTRRGLRRRYQASRIVRLLRARVRLKFGVPQYTAANLATVRHFLQAQTDVVATIEAIPLVRIFDRVITWAFNPSHSDIATQIAMSRRSWLPLWFNQLVLRRHLFDQYSPNG
jgi:hypothetical protein